MLDDNLKSQLREVFSGLVGDFVLLVEVPSGGHPSGGDMLELVGGVAEVSDRLGMQVVEGEELRLSIVRDGLVSGVSFRAVPNGHEFTSLLLAVLNLGGSGKNMPDEFISQRIKALRGEIRLTTYMSLTCTNCPEVVQTLNMMSVLNTRIRHEAVDGTLYKAEVERLGVQSVPTVYADGELLYVGRGGVVELLGKLEEKYGSEGEVVVGQGADAREYDVAVVGGGPAGATAALYLARKGLSVAVVTKKVGGQVNETSDIENLPSVVTTTGAKLASDLRGHMSQYPNIEVLENRTVVGVTTEARIKRLVVQGGEIVEAKQLIITTGAQWRQLGVEGESEYIGRGVAFCPHCDGPLFKGRDVAVIGGGNSGVEAAIDLAGICRSVRLYEFMDTLKADSVLQEKLNSLDNVEVFTSYQTVRIVGDGAKVVGIEAQGRVTNALHFVALDGVFVQIGLSANSGVFQELVEVNQRGEIIVDKDCRTSLKGVYAAGDVTDVSYKQIVISMGEGAKAALSAFDDSIRGVF